MSEIYTDDCPKDCQYCYYIGKHGCMLKKCFYIKPEEKKPVSECDNCPYGKGGPCIGWCTKKILSSGEGRCAK